MTDHTNRRQLLIHSYHSSLQRIVMLEARCRLAFDVSPTKCPRTSKRELGDVDIPREKAVASPAGRYPTPAMSVLPDD